MDYILGRGITGLVSSLYFEKCGIIGKSEGQDAIQLGPRILKKTIHVDNFLRKFNINLPLESLTCRFYYKGKIYETASEDIHHEYLKKTRGKEWEKFLKSGMNDNMTSIEGYNINSLYKEIKERVEDRIIIGEVKSIIMYGYGERNSPFNGLIFIKRRGDKYTSKYWFNKLINTFPAPVYNELLGIEKSVITTLLPIYTYRIKSQKLEEIMKGCDFMYFPDSDVGYYRATRAGEDFILESLTPAEYTAKCIWDLGIIETVGVVKEEIIRYGKVIDNVPPICSNYVLHIGRYANNSQSIRLHNVIESLEKGVEQ